MRFTVIGAANIDIITKSTDRIIHADSNPASIRLNAGGVARNIAENLSRYGVEVEVEAGVGVGSGSGSGVEVDFITAVGNDHFGGFLREKCDACGMNTGSWIVREGMNTGVYSAALDCDGELYVGFNAMSVLESINPGDIPPLSNLITNADLLIVDANLPEAALVAIAELRGGLPVMADAVSVSKAPRLGCIMKKISILKLNRAEAECLTGLILDDEAKLRHACSLLMQKGAGRVMITLGAEGLCAADSGGVLFLPAKAVMVKNVTGAGDALAAGVALRFHQDLKSQAEHGASLAARHLAGNA